MTCSHQAKHRKTAIIANIIRSQNGVQINWPILPMARKTLGLWQFFLNIKRFTSKRTIRDLWIIFCLSVSAVWIVSTLVTGGDTQTSTATIEFVWTFCTQSSGDAKTLHPSHRVELSLHNILNCTYPWLTVFTGDSGLLFSEDCWSTTSFTSLSESVSFGSSILKMDFSNSYQYDPNMKD